MIPCLICGKDSGTHYVTGFVPAPDSQKMALCAQHDAPENRRKLHALWQATMEESIRRMTANAAYLVTRSRLRMLTISFSGGGSLSLPCLDCSVTDHNALKVTAPNGSLSFFPMQHIRRYDLHAVFTEQAETSNDTA